MTTYEKLALALAFLQVVIGILQLLKYSEVVPATEEAKKPIWKR